MSGFQFFVDGGSGPVPPVWPPAPREPLPAYPEPTATQPDGPYASAWTYSPFSKDLPFTPPDKPTLDFHRGNFCGLRVPGLPPVPGGCDVDPSLVMTWFEYLYPPDARDRFLASYRAAGYTHMDYHRDAWRGVLNGGTVPGCSMSQAQDEVRRTIDHGIPYVIVNLADTDMPSPGDAAYWIEFMKDAGASIINIAWQADQRFSPLVLCDYINWVCPMVHSYGLKTAIHWVNRACAWWDDPKDTPAPNTCTRYGVCDRFSFQRWTSGKLDFHYMQQDTNGQIADFRFREGGLLVEIEEVLRSLTTQKLVIAEYDAQSEFDFPHERLELYGDLKGRCMLTATRGLVVDGGYLNGARHPDGRVV